MPVPVERAQEREIQGQESGRDVGDAPTIGARNVSDAPAGVFPEGMPVRESFEKLRAGWDADAAKSVIDTVNL